MQHKKRTYNIGRFKHYLHSIPKLFIMMKKNVKSNVLYSIPSVCVLVLLFGGMVDILWYKKSFASSISQSTAKDFASIKPVNAPTNPATLSMSLSNPDMVNSNVIPGSTATVSTNVVVSISDAESYSLTLSVDNMTMENSGTVITAGNVATDNTWGYKWDNDSNYSAPSTVGTILTVPALVDGATSFTKTLTFGANFSQDAKPGHYAASGTLSLVAMPKVTTATLVDLTQMQQITPEICSATPYLDGQTYSAEYTLVDVRDNAKYTVRKFGDGKCWMTSNLKLSNVVFPEDDSDLIYFKDRHLIPTTSDISNDWVLPAPSTTGFSDTTSNIYYDTSMKSGYYSWCGATAGTCPSNGDAPSSVCPKGWSLPSGGTNGEYAALLIAENISSSAVGSAKIQSQPYNFVNTGQVLNGVFNKPSNPGFETGFWWSRTAYSYNGAYSLLVMKSMLRPGTSDNARGCGFAIRCVAYS